MYSVNPGAARSSQELLRALVVGSNVGRPDRSRTNSAMKEGIEKRE